MKLIFVLVPFLAAAAPMVAQNKKSGFFGKQPDLAQGIFQSVENAEVRQAGPDLVLRRGISGAPMKLLFTHCQALGVQREDDQSWILPTNVTAAPVHANSDLWLLPQDATSSGYSWHIKLDGNEATAAKTGTGITVSLQAASVTLSKAEARPHSDPFGHRFTITIGESTALGDALAAFYWGTMLPSVVEKTMAAKFRYSSGYILSTLKVSSYAGSYPAVDHEFQIKGRLAMATEADLDIVKRMIELQFRLMNDDPERLSRSPTSVQPNGTREYHIRRNSKDNTQNAAMFPLTANIEVIEEAWQYYEARKDLDWLRQNILNLENAAGWILQNTDPLGRVWSDVYYEDQVIKDGRETQAQAFAAYTFQLLASMESLLDHKEKAARYTSISKSMAEALIAPLPTGYWDNDHRRFIDWVDRNGQAHDHIHLLANTLPVTLGYATEAQAAAVRQLIKDNDQEFERFPSFVAADIAAYSGSEMGTAGPYDLSAAGRYWYWDAAYRASQDQNALLLRQLETVAAEARKDNYFMGERYDMDHVYYIDGRNAHGAEQYYEYPNVYAAVLIAQYLGLTQPADADVAVAPHLSGPADVEFQTPNYALHYTADANGFTLRNLASKPRRFLVDLSAITPANAHFQRDGSSPQRTDTPSTITLSARGQAHWLLQLEPSVAK